MGLSGRTDSSAVEFGREACRVRKSPAYRKLDSRKCVERSVGDAAVSGRF